MKNPRLRLDRVLSRSLAEVRREERAHPPHIPTIVEESTAEINDRIKHLREVHVTDSTSLLYLYNVQRVDFVHLHDNHYVPVDWPKQATHRLRPTSWNTEPTRSMPNPTWALSVCTIPLRPRVHRSSIQIRHPIPRQGSVYLSASGLAGKRAVLLQLLIAMKAKVPVRVIPRLTLAECDLLYQQLARASRLLLLHRHLS